MLDISAEDCERKAAIMATRTLLVSTASRSVAKGLLCEPPRVQPCLLYRCSPWPPIALCCELLQVSEFSVIWNGAEGSHGLHLVLAPGTQGWDWELLAWRMSVRASM